MCDKYKIMLVDDEEEVRKSIIKKIKWEELGFEIATDAENGQDALEKLEYIEPDLIITDIRMPFMDGLKMAAEVKKRFPFIKIIIFSGFDDFEYAKEAISLDIIEYVLKPVNVEELTEILKKVKNILDEEILNKRDMDKLRADFVKSLPILREKLLGDLLRDKLSSEDITEENLNNYEINLVNKKFWVVSTLSIQMPPKSSSFVFHKEKDLIPISIREFFRDSLNNKFDFEIFIHSDYTVIIAGVDSDIEMTNFIEVINDTCRECIKIFKLNVTAGVGQMYSNLIDSHISYRESINALDYKNIIGQGKAIFIKDVEPHKKNQAPLKLSSELEREFLVTVKFGNEEKINDVINKIISNMDKDKLLLSNYQVYLIGILNSIVHLIQQYQLDINYIIGSEINYFEILSSFHTTEDLKVWLLDVYKKINHGITKSLDSTTKELITNAKNHILENFQNPDLSVEMICDNLHISPTYFSSIFKKETGESYIKYLTNIRLSYAKDLLKNTDEKTYVIAIKSGYTETSYFSYVFKKNLGMSPSKYRGLQ